MSDLGEDIIAQWHRAEVERILAENGGKLPVTPTNRPTTIHHTELGDAKSDSPLYREWNVYRGNIARLLTEGQEGRFVLIKGQEIIGVYDNEADAQETGYHRYPNQSFLVHQIREREPLLWLGPWWYLWLS